MKTFCLLPSASVFEPVKLTLVSGFSRIAEPFSSCKLAILSSEVATSDPTSTDVFTWTGACSVEPGRLTTTLPLSELTRAPLAEGFC